MWLRRKKEETQDFTGLFCSLIALFVIIPFFEGHALAEEIFVSAFSLILLHTLYTLYARRRRFFAIAVIGAVALCFNLVSYLTPYVSIDNLSLIFNALFFAYAVFLIFIKVFRSRTVTVNVILGAVCVYLLMGIAWGMGYALLDVFIPNSFHFNDGLQILSQTDGLVRHFIYYSLVTLSTVGYGDITPLSAPARYFSMLEAVAGQVYLSVLVARLVGMHIVQK